MTVEAKGRKNLRKARRLAAKAQDGKCCYCGGRLFAHHEGISRKAPALLTAEHIQMRAHGGGNDTENIAAACQGCNSARPAGMDRKAFITLRVRLLAMWPPCTYPSLMVRRDFLNPRRAA